jgi:pimeloyl-ACP methyl ester carboxylesterase
MSSRAHRRQFLTGMAAGLASSALAPVVGRASMTNNRGATIVAQHADEAVTSDYLTVPGARLYYEVSGSGPVLLLIHGAPADAGVFTPLVSLLEEDYTVVRYDTRGISRSLRDDPTADIPIEVHADDARRMLAQFGDEPAYVLGSSGGAVIGLALTERYPEQVRTLVAHEPPAAALLPDREQALPAIVDIHETYNRDGFGPGMAKFIALTSLKGPIPAGFADQPVDPASFGFPAEDDGARDDPMLGRNIIATTHYEHDFDALRAAPTRIVIGAGAESEGEMAHRAALAVAERLGTEPVIFPSHHGGFLGGEFGWAGDPDAFAPKLREVLAS